MPVPASEYAPNLQVGQHVLAHNNRQAAREMSYIPDLKAVSYSKLTGPIRAVGWLESQFPFTRGPVEAEFSHRLMALIERPVWGLLSLGMYWCSLCEADGKCGPDNRSSQAVLLVPAPSCVYEAPIWIGHYVLGHSYQPPAEFCRAVMSCPEPGSDEFRDALVTHLPELANLAARKTGSIFMGADFGVELAQRTLRPDPDYGCEKRFRDAIDAVTPEDKETRNQQRQKDDLKFYEQLGPEDAERPCRKDGCQRGAIRFSVFCRQHHFKQIKRRECPFDH
jgi:hypothetical protein